MILEQLKTRRSIRQFDRRPVEPEKIDRLVETALRAPSSRGLSPWTFVVVTDPLLLDALSQCKPHGATFVKDAPLAVVVAADPQVSDVWVEDTAIATLLIHLEAHAMGLGSCWVQVRKRARDASTSAGEAVAARLGLPANLSVEALVAIGYPAQTLPGHKADTLKSDRVHCDRYGNPYGAPKAV